MGKAAARLGALAAALYMALPLRSSPNPVDGGLLYGYLQTLADGGRPFHDFLDVYGVAHWPLLLAAHELAGQHMLGVRVLLWLLKLLTLLAAHRLVLRLADRRAAWLSTLCLTVLLGLPWDYLQTPYAFVPVQLLSLLVLLLLTGAGRRAALLGAGVLTGIALCMKLNSGAFILGGGLISVAYFREEPEAAPGPATPPSLAWHSLRSAGLVALVAILGAFVRPHFDGYYFLYLAVPVLLCALWARSTPDALGMRARLRDAVLYAGASLGTALGYLALVVGPGSVPRYFSEVGAILLRLRYHSPLPALAQPGRYVGFNEWLWPQLPWLVTLLGAGLFVHARSSRRPLSGRLGTLFAAYTCQLFVIYARSDETHLLQALPLTFVTLFVLLHALAQRLAGRAPWHGAAVALALCWTASLASWPGLSRLLGPGDWHGPRLAGLWYVDDRFDHYRRNPGTLDLRSWDATTDAAAQYIASISSPGTRTLLLEPTELLSFASGTVPAGGRHHYLFYLVQAGFFTRADFDAVAPATLLPGLLRNPPEVIVNTFVPGLSEAAFPELRRLLARRYRLGRRFRHLNVWLRRDLGAR
jgi:hypothetical protein